MIVLKESQKEKYDLIISAIEAGEKRIILKGSAGTGKTILVSELVKYYLTTFKKWDTAKVFVTAPTNKALSILQDKIDNHKNLTFATVHSALKLQRDINSRTGVVKYVPGFTKGKEPPFSNCKIAFVDECSMLNTDLITYLNKFNFPIIFIGDEKQINPVGELETPIFNKNYPEFGLTEIIRQGAGNPIIDLSRDLDLMWFGKECLIDNKGYIYNNDKTSIIDNLAEVNGTDDMKYLAWTNMEVDDMNKLVRYKIYQNPKKVEPRETLIFKEPYGDFWTNQEITVKDLKIVDRIFHVPNHKTKYEMGNWIDSSKQSFKVYLINGQVPVVHEDSELEFMETKRLITANCRSKNWNWKGYYYFLEQFANLTYNHAISVHKSQGSSYKEAIINVGNLNLNKNAEEKQRLFYTAVTRASDLLVLSNVR